MQECSSFLQQRDQSTARRQSETDRHTERERDRKRNEHTREGSMITVQDTVTTTGV
jgi:hypothetical protein